MPVFDCGHTPGVRAADDRRARRGL